MTGLCRQCGEPLRPMFPCLVCEYEAKLGRQLRRIPTPVEVEQPRMFELPKSKRPSTKDLYEAAHRHGDAA